MLDHLVSIGRAITLKEKKGKQFYRKLKIILYTYIQKKKLKAVCRSSPSVNSPLTSNIPQGPDSLFTNMEMRRCNETDESGNGSSFHHSCSLIGRPGCNVSKGPGCFELNRWRLRHAQEAYKLRDESGTDDSIYGWMPLPRQQLPKPMKPHDYKRQRHIMKEGNAFPTNYELAHLAAWVACTWVSRLLLLTPLTISSTVQCWACHQKKKKNTYDDYIYTHTHIYWQHTTAVY